MRLTQKQIKELGENLNAKDITYMNSNEYYKLKDDEGFMREICWSFRNIWSEWGYITRSKDKGLLYYSK